MSVKIRRIKVFISIGLHIWNCTTELWRRHRPSDAYCNLISATGHSFFKKMALKNLPSVYLRMTDVYEGQN